MLPAPRGAYPGTRPTDSGTWVGDPSGEEYNHPCSNFDLYRAKNWDLGLAEEQTRALQVVLDGTSQFHRDLLAAHRELLPQERERMLVIAGVGFSTLFRLEYRSHLFGAWESMAKIIDRVPGDPHREGDGRVPVASASLDGVEIRYVRGVHGGLTNIPAVWEDVFRWLNEETLELPDSAAGALSGHLAAGGSESLAPNLDGSARAQRYSDDPGFLELEPIPADRLESYDAALNAGALQEFTRVKLL